jgi:hypothetical protein
MCAGQTISNEIRVADSALEAGYKGEKNRIGSAEARQYKERHYACQGQRRDQVVSCSRQGIETRGVAMTTVVFVKDIYADD